METAIDFQWVMADLTDKAKANLEQDGFVAPCVLIYTQTGAMVPIGVASEQLLTSESLANEVRELLWAEGGLCYVVICDTFASSREAPGKTDAIFTPTLHNSAASGGELECLQGMKDIEESFADPGVSVEGEGQDALGVSQASGAV